MTLSSKSVAPLMDTIKAFLDSKACEPISTEKQKELARRAIEENDFQARVSLVNSVLRYNFDKATEIANKFNPRLDYGLYMRGYEHIWESSLKYDYRPESTANFLTFVKRLVPLKMMDALKEFHLLAPKKNKWEKVDVEVKNYDQNGYPVYTIEKKTFESKVFVESFEKPSRGEEDSNYESPYLTDSTGSVEDAYIRQEEAEFVEHIFNKVLTPMQRDAVNAVSGGITESGFSIQDVADSYGYSHERIRQIGNDISKKLIAKYGNEIFFNY